MISEVISAGRFDPALAMTAARLARRCRRRAAMPVFLHSVDSRLDRHLFGFSRQRGSLHLAISRAVLKDDPGTAVQRLPAMAMVLARCDAGVRGIADFSDGERCGDGIVSLCANQPGSLLIPDAEFVLADGYRALREASLDTPAFESRRDTVLWRGSTTGTEGAISVPGMTADTPALLQRTRMCLLLRDVPGCDARIMCVVQSRDVSADVRRLAAAGILGQRIEAEEWLNVRYHIAVDGNTLAWSSTFTRLLMGCCLLKPENAAAYRLWYSDRFEPWRHYVPVAADLHDLVGKIEWCRANPVDAARIAAAGQAFARGLQLEDEAAQAAANISRAWRQGALAGDGAAMADLLTVLP